MLLRSLFARPLFARSPRFNFAPWLVLRVPHRFASRSAQTRGGAMAGGTGELAKAAVEADHYDRDDSDAEDEALRQHTSKRRKIEEDNAQQQPQQPQQASDETPQRGSKPSASSRQTAADRDKKKVHADDAKNTQSIASFFGGKPRDTKKDAAKGKADMAAFFAPRTAKASGRKESEEKKDDREETSAQEKEEKEEKGEKSEVAEEHDERKAEDTAMDSAADDEKAGSGETAADAQPAKSAATSPTKQEQSDKQPAKLASPKKQAAAAAAPSGASKKRAAADSREAAGKAASGKGKGKRRGLMSSMDKKKQAAGKLDEDDEEEGAAEKVRGGEDIDMSSVVEKEEAAIEEEDAVDSAEEEEDDVDLASALVHTDSTTHPFFTGASASPLGTPSYHPIKHASWAAGQPVPYSALSAMFACVEAESSRLKIIAIVSDFFRSVLALTPQDILPTVYLCINSIAPAYEGKETGVGDFILKKVIAQTTGLSLARLRVEAKDVTDLGVLALQSRKKQVTLFTAPPLTVRGVFGTMREMGSMTGKAVTSKKEGMITKLMVASKGEEAKFLIRSLQGSLRIGLQIKSVIASLARALIITPPAPAAATESKHDEGSPVKQVVDTRQQLGEKKFQAALEEGISILKQAYIEVPNLDLLVDKILQYGLTELPKHCSLTPGVPIEVMLGKPASSIVAILDKFSEVLFTLEYKYDGERAQVHRLRDGTVRVYSRNSENNTGKYPDIVRQLKSYEVEGKCQEYIIGTPEAALTHELHPSRWLQRLMLCPSSAVALCRQDCECVAFDNKERRLLPFQTLTTRKRKDVKEEDITVQVR